jgi:membrane-associated phospholipid phosphatase
VVPGGALALTRARLVDKLLACYGLIVGVYAATQLGRPGIVSVMLAHLALPALAWLVSTARPSPTLRVIRAVYPVLLLTGLYSAIDVLNGFGAAPTWDRFPQALDQWLFHMQPSRDWWRAHPSAFWSTLLHADYLSYYLVVSVPVIVFLIRGMTDALDRYLDLLLATYLTCYLFYLFTPVAGPYYEFARPTGAFIANLPARWVYAALSGGSAFGAAFPSSHVAATVAATIGAWRGIPRLGMVLLVPTALLTVAVVYCQMHYATDSLAGVLTAFLVAAVVVSLGTRSGESRERREGHAA